jgi:hypothetical protein
MISDLCPLTPTNRHIERSQSGVPVSALNVFNERLKRSFVCCEARAYVYLRD